MPTAAPATAATTGLVAPLNAIMKRNTARSSMPAPSAGREVFMKSSRSLPAVKISGLPTIRMARTAASCSPSLMASAMLWYIADVIAFLRSGRLNSIVNTPPALLLKISMSSPIEKGAAEIPQRPFLSSIARKLDALENPGRAHAGADAHRHHAVLEVIATQRVDYGGGADRTGRAQREIGRA